MKMGRRGELTPKFPARQNRLINGHEGIVWVPEQQRFDIVLIRGGDSVDPTRYTEDESYFEYGCDQADGLFCDSMYVNPDYLAAIAAKARGAQVWICDIAPMKLAYAEQFGLDGTILNSSPEAFEQAWKNLTDGDGFDVTIECVGLPGTLQNCLDAACFGGRVSVIGIGKHNIDLDFTIIQKKELNIFGSRNALTKDFEELIDLAAGRPLGIDRIVTNEYPFVQAPRAFEDFHRNAGSMLKVMLKFDS